MICSWWVSSRFFPSLIINHLGKCCRSSLSQGLAIHTLSPHTQQKQPLGLLNLSQPDSQERWQSCPVTSLSSDCPSLLLWDTLQVVLLSKHSFSRWPLVRVPRPLCPLLSLRVTGWGRCTIWMKCFQVTKTESKELRSRCFNGVSVTRGRTRGTVFVPECDRIVGAGDFGLVVGPEIIKHGPRSQCGEIPAQEPPPPPPYLDDNPSVH